MFYILEFRILVPRNGAMCQFTDVLRSLDNVGSFCEFRTEREKESREEIKTEGGENLKEFKRRNQ